MHSPADIEQLLRPIGLMPVITLEDAAIAADLAGALITGGLPAVEVTLRTPAAAAAMRAMADRGGLLVGAGTVLTEEQVDLAIDSGAQFAVSPGLGPKVVARCQAKGLPIFPGVCTPTDVQAALEMGLETLKFFPAEACGGPAALKALGGPFGGVRFLPTGGITAARLPEYLKLPNVIACGGSWIIKSPIDLAAVEQAAREGRAIVDQLER